MDAMMTVTCIYVPVRPIFTVAMLMCGTSSFAVSMVISKVDTSLPFFIFGFLAVFAIMGASDQQRCRQREWQALANMHESSLLREAIERVARIFCDLVIFLDTEFTVYTDSREFRAFFQEQADGRSFTDFIATSEDIERFKSMVATTCKTDAPGRITVTLLQRHGLQKVDADLFISRTHKGVILGIAVSKEQLPTMESTGEMTPRAQVVGVRCDLLNSDDQTESLNGASTSAWSTPTEQMFAEASIEHILNLGELEHWMVPAGMLNINFKTILGEGGFSVVYSGHIAGAPVAVKLPKGRLIHNETETHEHMRCVLNEVRIYRHVRHRNIVTFHGATLVNGQLAVVLENISGQCLSAFVYQDTLQTSWQTSLILDLLSAVWYLHAREPSIVHGDLKPSNAMVELCVPFQQGLTPHLKLIDFGLSRLLGRKPQSMGGTAKWTAPELQNEGNKATVFADMYSVGCVMCFILTTNTPVSHHQEHLASPLHWPAGETSTKAVSICEACVCLDAEARPSAAHVFVQMHAVVDEC